MLKKKKYYLPCPLTYNTSKNTPKKCVENYLKKTQTFVEGHRKDLNKVRKIYVPGWKDSIL